MSGWDLDYEYHPHFEDVVLKKKNSRKCRRSRKLDKLIKRDVRCPYCNKHLNRLNASLDHVVPVSRGGKNGDQNVVAACKDCNQAKGDMLPLNFFISR